MKAWTAACAMLLLSGCERAMHNMYDQPKYHPGSASTLFADGHAGRTPPFGTVPAASGIQAGTSSGRLGHDQQTTVTGTLDAGGYRALLQRGQARYDIYCAPCHGLAGNGDGMVVARGFPAPPPFTRPDLMNAKDLQLEQVISRGYGLMYSFADRVDAYDRHAIVAYIRALQLSQHASAAQLQAQDRQALRASATTTQPAR